MGGSSKKVTVGYKYYLGMHMVLCHGPVDAVTQINVDNRDTWAGFSTGGRISINRPSLFGGEEREGGIAGNVDIEMGGPSQDVNDYLRARLGSNTPPFRGVLAAVLRRVYIGMNPYLKPWAFRAQRVFTRSGGAPQWYEGVAGITQKNIEERVLYENWSGGFSGWAVTQGTSNDFDIDGGALRITGTEGAGNISKLSKQISPDASFTVVRVQVNPVSRDPQSDSEDVGVFQLEDKNGNVIFNFTPVRDATVDPLRRAHITFYSGQSGLILSDGMLQLNRWYQLEVVIERATGEVRGSLSVRDTGETIKSGKGISVFTYNPARWAVFRNETSHGDGGVSLWDNLEIYAGTFKDMNPAHIIRECLTDSVWGMGYAEADIDETSFQEAANVLFQESFGLSLLWDRQIPLEDFVGEVLKHIDAVLRVNRRTGKFELKLVRDDYDPDTLLVLDPSNVQKVEDYSRPSFGELVNSVSVNYWDARTGAEASLSVQDIALISVQGTTINTTVQYPGITTQRLASRVASRDLKTLSNPLVSCVLYVNQAAKDLSVGDVFKLTWPDYNVEGMVMRVTSIAYGNGRSNRIKIQAAQDIFGLPESVMPDGNEEDWEDPVQAPEPAQNRILTEATYFNLLLQMGHTQLEQELLDVPEMGYFITTAGRPSDGSINMQLRVDSGAGYEDVGVIDFCPTGKTVAVLGKFDTTVVLEEVEDGDLIEVGTRAYIGTEMVAVTSWDAGTGTLGITRSILDTIPKEHPAGSVVYFAELYLDGDETEYVDGDQISIKLLPVTGEGVLDEAGAPADLIELNARAIRPFRPANLRANGELEPDPEVYPDYPVAISWVERNRLQETTTTYLSWTDPGVGAEAGTDYRVLVEAIQENGTVDGVVADVTQTALSYSLEESAIGALSSSPFMRVTVTSRRDGWDCWQSPSIRFRGPLRPPNGLTATFVDVVPPTGLTAENVTN